MDPTKVLKYILKKWYVVLLCALIGAGALYAEKAKVAPSVAVTGDQLYTRTLRVEPMPTYELGNTVRELNLIDMAITKRALYAYMKEIDARLDFEKLYKGWHNLKQKDKMTWVKQHASLNKVGPGLYEVSIEFTSTDAKDAAYVDENSGVLLDIITQTIEKATALQTGGAKLVTVDEQNLSDMHEVVSQGTVQKKYVAVGFVLGALVGAAVLAALSMRTREAD